MFLDFGFGRLVIRVRAVEANASGGSGIIEVGAQHVPPLAQVQNAMMALSRPALGGDAKPLCFGHVLPKSLTGPVSMGLSVP